MSAEQKLIAAVRKLGLRELVAGWNGENRADGPYEPHPAKLGVTLRTNAGTVYEIDRALEAFAATPKPEPVHSAMAYAKSIVEAVEQGCTYEDKVLAVRDFLKRAGVV